MLTNIDDYDDYHEDLQLLINEIDKHITEHTDENEDGRP